MDDLQVYLRKLQKAIRLLDHFTVATAKLSGHLKASGDDMESEHLVELVLKLQDAGLHMDLAEMRLR